MRLKWIAAVAVLAGTCAALVYVARPEETGDLADRPTASIWLKSSVRRVDGSLRMDVDTSDVVVRDGEEEFRPPWTSLGHEIKRSITQVGDENSAPQSVTGTVTYMTAVRRWNFLKFRRDAEFVSCAFEFTGDFRPGQDGVRWWRLRRVVPRADGNDKGDE